MVNIKSAKADEYNITADLAAKSEAYWWGLNNLSSLNIAKNKRITVYKLNK